MTVTRTFAAAAAFACVAIGTTSTAWADSPTMSGHYTETVSQPDGTTSTNDWDVAPCGDGCANITFSNGDTQQARLVNGQWTMDHTSRVACGNSIVDNALDSHYVWDPNTLAGTVRDTVKVEACGFGAVGHTFTSNIQFRPAR